MRMANTPAIHSRLVTKYEAPEKRRRPVYPFDLPVGRVSAAVASSDYFWSPRFQAAAGHTLLCEPLDGAGDRGAGTGCSRRRSMTVPDLRRTRPCLAFSRRSPATAGAPGQMRPAATPNDLRPQTNALFAHLWPTRPGSRLKGSSARRSPRAVRDLPLARAHRSCESTR